MKKKTPQAPPVAQVTPSPVQRQSFAISDEERQARNRNIEQSTSAADMMRPTISRLTERDITGETPFRRALTQQKYSGAANAYENAQARTRERGAAAGMGGPGPQMFGAQTALANENAAALARIPGEVELESLQPELQGASLAGDMAGRYQSAAGLYSPESFYGSGVGLESQRQGNVESELDRRFQEEENRKQRKSALFGSLIGAAAAPFTGGFSKGG